CHSVSLLLCASYSLGIFLIERDPPSSTLFPYTTLFRSQHVGVVHDPLEPLRAVVRDHGVPAQLGAVVGEQVEEGVDGVLAAVARSEEHTSELQSRENLVCRLLLEKKNDSAYSMRNVSGL